MKRLLVAVLMALALTGSVVATHVYDTSHVVYADEGSIPDSPPAPC